MIAKELKAHYCQGLGVVFRGKKVYKCTYVRDVKDGLSENVQNGNYRDGQKIYKC